METDWNHFRYVLALHQHGTVRAAANALRVHHATISRHLASIQEQLGVRLVERQGRRFAFTDAGRRFLEAAEAMDELVGMTTRELTGRDSGLRGTVRVALPESWLHVLAPRFALFSEAHSGIVLELLTGLSFKNLARTEADVALRITSSPPETLVGKRIGSISMRAYGRRTLLDKCEPCGVADYPWLGWSDAYAHFPMERWLREAVGKEKVRLTVTSTADLLRLVQGGAGVGVLPSFVCGPDEKLRLAECELLPRFESDVWVLLHEDLRSVPRVRAVAEWLGEECRTLLQLAHSSDEVDGVNGAKR